MIKNLANNLIAGIAKTIARPGAEKLSRILCPGEQALSSRQANREANREVLQTLSRFLPVLSN
jgi:hypothetical protein